MVEGQEGVTWEDWVALAGACEECGYEALFRSDHYGPVVSEEERGSLDAWATLAGLAAVTSTVRLGTLVSPATFRHPAVLAKSAVTVDRISGGRVEVGMGAGWNEAEHVRYGFPFPPMRERMDLLAEQLEEVRRQWEEEPFRPKPVQSPHPPLIVGGRGGRRSVALAARWADEYNTFSTTPEECRALRGRVAEACEREGRDPLPVSVMTRLVREPDEAIRLLTELAEAGVERVMLQHLEHSDLDALRVVAEDVAPRLR
jgi:alkanesulfonate monooxygenase SsuD/methylene tetrahydromethanopterin reductase-like flavin-dependent oxidoreductase (luciferase family)